MGDEQRPATRAGGRRRSPSRSCPPLGHASRIAIVFPSARKPIEGLERLLLMRPQLEDLTVLPGEKVVEVQQAGNPLQEQCELLLDLLGLIGDLPVGPAKNPPSLVDQAVLLEKSSSYLAIRSASGNVPGQPVDFKCHPLVERSARAKSMNRLPP